VLLRYVEMFGEMKRGITVLKMRGSLHDKGIREFTIDQKGMHLGRPFRNVTGILAGTPVHISPSDIERIWSHFDAEISDRRREHSTADTGERHRAPSERRRPSRDAT
jgi:circadian clock protein KaiC